MNAAQTMEDVCITVSTQLGATTVHVTLGIHWLVINVAVKILMSVIKEMVDVNTLVLTLLAVSHAFVIVDTS